MSMTWEGRLEQKGRDRADPVRIAPIKLQAVAHTRAEERRRGREKGRERARRGGTYYFSTHGTDEATFAIFSKNFLAPKNENPTPMPRPYAPPLDRRLAPSSTHYCSFARYASCMSKGGTKGGRNGRAGCTNVGTMRHASTLTCSCVKSRPRTERAIPT